jgi:WhiB family redox-sensing transcriptional regulator
MTVCEKCGREYAPLRRGYCNRCDMRRRSLIGYQCSYVDAEPTRLHVKNLQAAGLGLRRVAELARVDRKVLQWVMTGRSERGAPPSARLSARNAEKILAVPIPEVVHRAVAKGQLVDAAATVRLLQSLVAAGYTRAYLAAQLGMQPGNATRLFRDVRSVRADTAQRVEDLFNHLRASPGPSDIARAEGRKQGWSPPSDDGDSGASTAARRAAQHRRWAAELEERRLAKAARVDTDRLVEALRVALFGDDEEDWRERAVCAQVDPDLFFPEKGGSTRDAKKLCLSCPVGEECLDFALENEERFGIWGGKSERERRRLVKQAESARESA